MNNETRPKSVSELEGLRGLLAAWVVLGHILLFCGYSYSEGWFGILFSPVLGVYTFMMVSGFVIAGALDRQTDGWDRFLMRRFFRLYPTYMLCLVLAILLMPVSQFVAGHLKAPEFSAKSLERLGDLESQFTTYLLFDLSLLQGLAPKWLFPNAHESFLVPTWSLTLEWMFYLIAPFILLGLKRRPVWTFGGFGIACMAAFQFESQLVQWNPSFHCGNMFHFATGIGTYYVWKWLPAWKRARPIVTTVLFWITAAIGFFALGVPYKIWIAVSILFLYPVAHLRSLVVLELGRKFFNSPPLQYLGRISYSTYLVHWLVIEVCLFWMFSMLPETPSRWTFAIVLSAVVYPTTYAIAHLVFRYVELPGIELGKSWLHSASVPRNISSQQSTSSA